jgi:Ca2+-binding EF-hand superfamily protein
MKLPSLTLLIAAAIALGSAAPAEAAKGKKNRAGKGDKRSARVLARFDANHDGTIDTTEAERVRAAFDALKALDKDNDGKLSESEVVATKVPQAKGKKGRGKKSA